jgi:predicted DNA-binding ribbon-helix-helix protein
MSVDVELTENVFEMLEEVANARDMPVATLVDDILREWLEGNHESYVEPDEPEEEPNEDEDDYPDD